MPLDCVVVVCSYPLLEYICSPSSLLLEERMLLFEAFQLVTYDGVRLHSEMWTRDDLLEPSGTPGSHSSVSGLKSFLAIAIHRKMNRQLLMLVPSLVARCLGTARACRDMSRFLLSAVHNCLLVLPLLDVGLKAMKEEMPRKLVTSTDKLSKTRAAALFGRNQSAGRHHIHVRNASSFRGSSIPAEQSYD